MSAPGIGDPHSPRRGFFPASPASATTAETRSLADVDVDADQATALRREIARQEGVERKRQARIHCKRARRRETFVTPHLCVLTAARITRAKLMGQR